MLSKISDAAVGNDDAMGLMGLIGWRRSGENDVMLTTVGGCCCSGGGGSGCLGNMGGILQGAATMLNVELAPRRSFAGSPGDAAKPRGAAAAMSECTMLVLATSLQLVGLWQASL